MLPVEIEPTQTVYGNPTKQNHGDERIAGDERRQSGDHRETYEGDPHSVERSEHDRERIRRRRVSYRVAGAHCLM